MLHDHGCLTGFLIIFFGSNWTAEIIIQLANEKYIEFSFFNALCNALACIKSKKNYILDKFAFFFSEIVFLFIVNISFPVVCKICIFFVINTTSTKVNLFGFITKCDKISRFIRVAFTPDS